MHVLTQHLDAGEALERDRMDTAIDRALTYLTGRQAESGCWEGDYGGPLFLLPGYIATCYGTKTDIPPETRAEMVRYMLGTQNSDGGWGLHIESHSYLFTSSVVYVALRLCDVAPDHPALVRARAFIHRSGSPLKAASWGKFLLALLNLYDYRGLIPVPPELWLLPERLPVHPARTWCQARMIALPTSYLYGRRLKLPVNERIRELRRELYVQPYEQIAWEDARELVADSDAKAPLGMLAKAAARVLGAHEAAALKPWRTQALQFVLEQVEAEDRNSSYVCLNPIVKFYHMWIWHFLRPQGPELAAHRERMDDYLWHAADGVKVQGYHSSQLWDTAFAVQAVVASGETQQHRASLVNAYRFIDHNQVRENLPSRERYFRDPTKGGWGFSNKDNGWIVSDTTAEGLRAALMAAPHVDAPLSRERLRDAVDYLLWSQTQCGGWASYEPTRGPAWLEQLNYSNVFERVMIDYPYVECTAAALLGLSAYRERFPGDRDLEIAAAILKGRQFLLGEQRPDGSFEGSWGICFTYGTWFGIAGMRVAGLTSDDPRVARACDFLEQHQLPDGGWGETPESNLQRRYVHARRGQPVMTAWALLGLVAGGRARSECVTRGVRFLLDAQHQDGSYSSDHITGMFNRTCAIHYENYPAVFPLWALAEVRNQRAREYAEARRISDPSSSCDAPVGRLPA